LQALGRKGLLDRSIVIVTADHGEAFGEHGRMLHTSTPYEETIHVPLVVRFPPRFGRLPARWSGIVELRDLVPTICDALGLGCRVNAERSLLRLVRSGAGDGRVARAWTSDGNGVALGALTDGHKLVMDSRAHRLELYELSRDPGEERDLSFVRCALARRLARRLQGNRQEAALATASHPVADDIRRKLRALGYTR